MVKKNRKTIRPNLLVFKEPKTLWGSVTVNDNLIIDYASNLESLKKKMKKLVLVWENLEVSDFDISYDLSAFFDEYAYINILKISEKAGISYSIMRQYSTGNKYPSEVRVKLIQTVVREIGKELSKVTLHKPDKKTKLVKTRRRKPQLQA